jgi:hypothetical protein
MYKRLFLFVGIALLAVLLWSLAGKGTNATFQDAQELLQFRRIGHELLLSTGDTRSRVMPIEKISGNEFRVEFEKSIEFIPDSLVSVVSRVINPVLNKSHYIVNVTDVKTKEVIYSFGWPSMKENVPCTTRPLPEGKYALNILSSAEPSIVNPSRSTTIPVMAAALLSVFLGFFAWRFIRRKPAPAVSNHSFVSVGKFHFYAAQQLLAIDQASIELTSKETKLLRIFCESPNEVIDRNQLLKEGWEDEGVITGRSLDMYVSKLRKKLQQDPSVSIINVHGKGYRLNC